MSELTYLLDAAASGDRAAAAQVLSLVYDELRQLAAIRMAGENAGHSLGATALVHEAYLRMVDLRFDNRGQFFAAASEAMRRILVDHARAKRANKRGGQAAGARFDPTDLEAAPFDSDRWLDLHEALSRFEAIDPDAARLAALRIFGGLSVADAGESLGLARASAYRLWGYAEAWLTARLSDATDLSGDAR